MANLKRIAERRTDIFGSGDVETEIGRKVRWRPAAAMGCGALIVHSVVTLFSWLTGGLV
jgi:hypothetical protein